MSTKENKSTQLSDIDRFRIEVRSSLTAIFGILLSILFICGTTLLIDLLVVDPYLMETIGVIFAYSTTGILGLLFLFYITIFIRYYIKLKRKEKENYVTFEKQSEK